MIEITNKTRGPVQLIVKTGQVAAEKRSIRNFTVLNIPGIGANNNVRYLEDERHTKYIDEAEKKGLIKTRKITKASIKGE